MLQFAIFVRNCILGRKREREKEREREIASITNRFDYLFYCTIFVTYFFCYQLDFLLMFYSF
jgi:hypothetical protein